MRLEVRTSSWGQSTLLLSELAWGDPNSVPPDALPARQHAGCLNPAPERPPVPLAPALCPLTFQLQVLVLNGERYREICPENTLLDAASLRTCTLAAPTPKKPLLKREGGLGMTEDGRILLVPEVRAGGRGGRFGGLGAGRRGTGVAPLPLEGSA
jgi:hypothetical protein